MSEPTVVSHDWTTSVKKYVPNANDAAIDGIVKHLGIALRGKDSSFVACTDKAERPRSRSFYEEKARACTR
jgi:hypothetical protein